MGLLLALPVVAALTAAPAGEAPASAATAAPGADAPRASSGTAPPTTTRAGTGTGARDTRAPVTAGPTTPPVTALPGAAPSPGATDGVRLLVPAVGLDLPVLPLTPDGTVIDPPTPGDAYWIEPYGDPVGSAAQTDNTLYIAAHSWAAGEAAFNPLLDRAQQRSAVAVGDAVQVSTPEGTADYTVRSTRRYAKGELPTAAEVWEVAPGRLVLITCFQRDDGSASTENFVVVASA